MRILIALLLMCISAQATWKPEYSTNPPSVQEWFQNATPPPEAIARLGIGKCCNNAERLLTKFVGQGTEWSYYPDPNCTAKNCTLLPIPNDVVHQGRINSPDPKDDNLPEFDAMRREGVLFIWNNRPSCFWPPLAGG